MPENEKNEDLVFKSWKYAIEDAADTIKQASRGVICRRSDPIALNKKLTPKQIELGYNYVPVSDDRMLRSCERILDRFVRDEEGKDLLSEFSHMSFDDLREKLLTDGITPALDTWNKFRDYWLLGPGYDKIDVEHPEVKKNLPDSASRATG